MTLYSEKTTTEVGLGYQKSLLASSTKEIFVDSFNKAHWKQFTK